MTLSAYALFINGPTEQYLFRFMLMLRPFVCPSFSVNWQLFRLKHSKNYGVCQRIVCTNRIVASAITINTGDNFDIMWLQLCVRGELTWYRVSCLVMCKRINFLLPYSNTQLVPVWSGRLLWK